MFGNFLYYIVALLIYTTFQPGNETNFAPAESILLFILATLLFAIFTRLQFKRLEKRLPFGNMVILDARYSALMTRHCIIAVAFFALDVYALNLPSFLADRFPFQAAPSLLALLFLGLFTAYLCIVWDAAHGAYRRLYDIGMSRRTYIFSNISLSIPILLPWLLLSAVADIFNILPLEWPKRFLSTTAGEVTYFVFFLFVVVITGPVLIQKFWRCKPLEHGRDRQRIEDLCRKAGLKYADILHWPIFGGRMITAGVMGLVRRFRYILVTDALLRFLEPEEIDTVVAHEIGHVKRNHLLFYLVFFIGYMLLYFAGINLITYLIIILQPVLRLISRMGISQSTLVTVFFNLMIIATFLVYFRFIFGYFMRNFERQADAYVYSLFENARPLISTFRKIAATSGQPADKPNWHHFSIKERIEFLEKCEGDRSWIRFQDRKIKRSIGIFLTGMLLAGALGYHLNFGDLGKQINKHFIEKIILYEIGKDPKDASLHALLGELYLERKNFPAAVEAYEKSLTLSADQPNVLNNLAWIYAACEDPLFRDSSKALHLALKAISLETSAYIFDTLAESYFVNGRYPEAVTAAQKALDSASDNRDYYERQLEKFKKALP
jgi:Zn-dependent protease with chaperone function